MENQHLAEFGGDFLVFAGMLSVHIRILIGFNLCF